MMIFESLGGRLAKTVAAATKPSARLHFRCRERPPRRHAPSIARCPVIGLLAASGRPARQVGRLLMLCVGCRRASWPRPAGASRPLAAVEAHDSGDNNLTSAAGARPARIRPPIGQRPRAPYAFLARAPLGAVRSAGGPQLRPLITRPARPPRKVFASRPPRAHLIRLNSIRARPAGRSASQPAARPVRRPEYQISRALNFKSESVAASGRPET